MRGGVYVSFIVEYKGYSLCLMNNIRLFLNSSMYDLKWCITASSVYINQNFSYATFEKIVFFIADIRVYHDDVSFDCEIISCAISQIRTLLSFTAAIIC